MYKSIKRKRILKNKICQNKEEIYTEKKLKKQRK